MRNLLYVLLLLGVVTLYGKVTVVNKTGTALTGYCPCVSGGQIVLDDTKGYSLDKEGTYNFSISSAPTSIVSINTKAYKSDTTITFTYQWEKLIHNP